MKEIYLQLIDQWELYIGDCYQSTDRYFLWINQGEMCLEESEVEYIVKHKIPMMDFIKYWDYMLEKHCPTLNFMQWYERNKNGYK